MSRVTASGWGAHRQRGRERQLVGHVQPVAAGAGSKLDDLRGTCRRQRAGTVSVLDREHKAQLAGLSFSGAAGRWTAAPVHSEQF